MRIAVFGLCLAALSGCDFDLGMIGLGPDPRLEAEARAIGASCRFGMRGIEDCYTLHRNIDKAAIYAGWREMDSYMRENQIEGIRAEIPLPPEPPPSAPVSAPPPPPPPPKEHSEEEEEEEEEPEQGGHAAQH
ncbi:hypothetical protein [Candidatus Symbiobacter mobilis]|uniref:Uncharacterized protein n=1 Tax=Candidatus Symbiobacter mobilis CR TaxID=946483 RepID=U5N4J8_9BURK|nr:hypothetical protein [Candidatus Symbiobacter mobilis]AGX86391.1 hypothetical protein Cenrod_0265 [Candidatus Symbiobacter mobilis CR]